MISIGLWLAGLFGKTPSLAGARKIGSWAVYIGIAVALTLLVIVGIKNYKAGVIEGYQDTRDAAVANATLAADREALANALDRANESEAEAEALNAAMADAKAADPQKGRSEVGPVSQSYFDSLPKKRN